MTYQELNQYILHYITEDKTKSAILLTGPWGTGKSHYIQNELKPFLEEKGSNIKCIIVSLYGLKDLFEVSKALYLECRAKFLNSGSEKAVAGKIVAKTIIKGVTSYFGVDLSKSEREMQKLFKSIDLSGKLIVLEDLERSGIDILDVLGYVNNLVEQDNVKVLLVANEDEIIKYEMGNRIISQQQKTEIEADKELHAAFGVRTENSTDVIRRQTSEDYLKIKEKTISDTIHFEGDYITAIKDIIQLFNNETLDKFSNPKSINNILEVMNACNTLNLRSFIFACQKSSDIFKILDKKYLSDADFIRAVYFGILFFVFRQKAGKTGKRGQEKYFSVELGNENAPLFMFCYDYITRQIEEFSDIEDAYNAYKELVLYDTYRSDGDNDINTLRTYYVQSEEEVRNALKSIENRLEDPKSISFYQYGTIAVYAIIVGQILEFNIDQIKSRLVDNLKGRGNELQFEQIFQTIMGDDCTSQQKAEYESLRNDMAKSMKFGDEILPNFSYRPEQSDVFYDYIIENKGRFQVQNSFVQQLDMKRLSEMFKNSTAMQKQQIRKAFLNMYHFTNIESFLDGNKDNLVLLLNYIKADKKCDVGDAIQNLQYDRFINDLEKIISELSYWTNRKQEEKSCLN